MSVPLVRDSRQAAEAAFRAAHRDYGNTDALDDLRARDYARLDAAGQVYLDYTGGGLDGFASGCWIRLGLLDSPRFPDSPRAQVKMISPPAAIA
jgi:hypothetical protein